MRAGLSRDGAIFGSALLMPIRAGGTIALALVFAALAGEWPSRSPPCSLCGRPRCRPPGRPLPDGPGPPSAGTSIDRSLAELPRRAPALRAHGTGGFERDRLSRTFAHDHRSVQGEERRLALSLRSPGRRFC